MYVLYQFNFWFFDNDEEWRVESWVPDDDDDDDVVVVVVSVVAVVVPKKIKW